jgi:septum formation protein maf
MKIILASSSPRRKELLQKLIHNFDIIPSNFNEDLLKNQITDPENLVKELSSIKAYDVFDLVKESNESLTVISADTIVAFQNEILGKPITEEKAYEMLEKLQGNQNDVYTGMTVIMKTNEKILEKTIVSKSSVFMKKMSKNDILEYISTKEPLDKAGAYAIQGIGQKYIESYEGNFDTIVGLDLCSLEKILKENQII